VQFYGYPDRQFPAQVKSLSSLISQDRRTLRVLFEIDDPQAVLKPGMFGEVGLGVEPRDALLVPDTAVLHVGRLHYLLVADGDDAWRVVPVNIGEIHSGQVEIIAGIKAQAKIVSVGGILLKPLVTQAIALETEGGP
jgi:multidrug efflux pump subunit AcrA (membrane-fusion protein)